MKKLTLALALLGATTLAGAQSWRFLPITDPGYPLKPTLALTFNRVSPYDAPDASAWGVDFNFNSGLIQSPDNRMRTHLQVHRSDEEGVKATVFELSPRYTWPLGESFSAGFGPSLTALRTRAAGVSRTFTGLGLAGGVNWNLGRVYVGADLRWHNTTRKSGVDYDGTALGLKAGINF
jgi:hypothetical protein